MTSSGENHVKRVGVVGAGLVGALEASLLAKRGFQVDLFELRGDIRKAEVVRGRSINLALSCRGRAALQAIGLEETIVKKGIPMYARMIHNREGPTNPIPYGTKEQYILSIDRRLLNEELITRAESFPNVKIHFNHKFVSCDFDAGQLIFEVSEDGRVSTKTYNVDLIIGADGAYSKVRNQLNRNTRFNFQQEYIPHGYMEVYFPPHPSGKRWIMEENYLHIWARNTFMMIGLPNPDFSFTGTLFMPFDKFAGLDTEEAVIEFFASEFPDAIPMIGEKNLGQQVASSKALPMVSIKCSPYNYLDKAVIVGDAAHAMVPFYGQGMNCGMEDCLVFEDCLSKHNNNLVDALREYSETRTVDAQAMCDLAMYNYVEMRAHVNSKLFLLRKLVDNLLHKIFGASWVPLYTSVSFQRMRYSHCIANKAWQDRLIENAFKLAGASVFVSATAGIFWSLGKGLLPLSSDEIKAAFGQ